MPTSVGFAFNCVVFTITSLLRAGGPFGTPLHMFLEHTLVLMLAEEKIEKP